MTRFTDTVSDLKSASVYALADRADCAPPDTHESVGAVFLARVRDDVLERVEDIAPEDFERETEDIGHEIADSAIPVMTYTKWQTFTDLGAWQTDVSDWLGGEEDLDTLGSYALYEIARTLTDAILTEIAEAIREDDVDDTDDESDVLIP